MKIFLLRHAHAEPGDIDASRALSPKGNKQMKQLAVSYVEQVLEEILVIEHSPYIRAVQTAQLFKKHSKKLSLKSSREFCRMIITGVRLKCWPKQPSHVF
jgi:phosphohistidine phosphatase SixA